MKVRYRVLAMLVLLSVITYMDRICIGVLAGPMKKDLGISEAGWGWVISAFLISYGLFEIPTGALGDTMGQRRVLTRIVVWWSAFTMATGVARNYYVLVATRFLFGAGEAGAYPNASGVISRWFPVTERARAQGLVWGASRVGGALTPLCIAPLLTVFPWWQLPFFIFGALGLVWAIAWSLWFKDDPAKHPAMTLGELAEIGITPRPDTLNRRGAEPQEDQAQVDTTLAKSTALNPYESPRAAATAHDASGHSGIPWLALASAPRLWLIIAMYWFYVFGAIFFMFTLTTYFIDGRGLTKADATIAVSLAFAAGALGNAIGGWTSDLLSRHHGRWVGRCLVGAICLTLTGLLQLATAFTPGKLPAAVLLIAAFGVMDGMLPCAWAVCLDVGKRYSGAVSGAMNTSGQAAGALCMILYGYFIQWFGNYEYPLVIFAVSMFIGAVFFALIDPSRPLLPEEPAPELAEEPACV